MRIYGIYFNKQGAEQDENVKALKEEIRQPNKQLIRFWYQFLYKNFLAILITERAHILSAVQQKVAAQMTILTITSGGDDAGAASTQCHDRSRRTRRRG
uniref:Uncharacterized protein n=1 Tax=Romanomermis culicivorax TaxID=13658 RepID=A0A915IAY9_ROMCU